MPQGRATGNSWCHLTSPLHGPRPLPEVVLPHPDRSRSSAKLYTITLRSVRSRSPTTVPAVDPVEERLRLRQRRLA